MNERITEIANEATSNLGYLFIDLMTAVTGCIVIVLIIYGIFVVKDVIDRAGGKRSESINEEKQ